MIETLETFGVFEGLSTKHVDLVSKRCKAVTVHSGDMIFSAGEHARSLFLILSGQIELRFDMRNGDGKVEVSLDRKLEGDVFGWSAMIPPHKYTLSAYAVDDCDLLQLDHDDLERVCEQDTRLGYLLMKNAARIVGQRYKLARMMLHEEIERSEARS